MTDHLTNVRSTRPDIATYMAKWSKVNVVAHEQERSAREEFYQALITWQYDEIERLSRPCNEREPPHCQSCNCSVQEKLPARSELAAILHLELDEWKNAGGPTLAVVNSIIDLIQHAIDATNIPDSALEPGTHAT